MLPWREPRVQQKVKNGIEKKTLDKSTLLWHTKVLVSRKGLVSPQWFAHTKQNRSRNAFFPLYTVTFDTLLPSFLFQFLL